MIRLSSLSLFALLFLGAPSFRPLMAECRIEGQRKICRDEEGEIRQVDRLGEDERVLSRDYYGENSRRASKLTEISYDEDSPYGSPWISNFRVFDEGGQHLRSFSNRDFKNCRAHVGEESAHQHRVLIGEMLGIDITHPQLKNKLLAAKEGEVSQGTCAGFYLSESEKFLPHVVKNHLPKTGLMDSDHGTMVSTIALKGVDNVKFYPVAGFFKSSKFFTGMKKAIENHDIKLANFSFSFTDYGNIMMSGRDRLVEAKEAVEQMIAELPKVQFVVSAGNGDYAMPTTRGINISRSFQFPSSFTEKNIFVIGAIDSNKVEKGKFESYRMARFSNYSVRRVDILAPGVGMNGGRVGGGNDRGKGTSFSAPFITNEIMKISNIAPRLSYKKIRELMMKTVYIPNLEKALNIGLGWKGTFTQQGREKGEWFPVRSGGVYHRARAFQTARKLANHPGMTLNEALKGVFSRPEFAKRKRLWEIREIPTRGLTFNFNFD